MSKNRSMLTAELKENYVAARYPSLSECPNDHIRNLILPQTCIWRKTLCLCLNAHRSCWFCGHHLTFVVDKIIIPRVGIKRK